MIWLVMTAYEDTEDEAADHITRSRVASCGNATQLCNLSVMHARLACPPACLRILRDRKSRQETEETREGGAEEGRKGGRDAWLVFISNQGWSQPARNAIRADGFCTLPSVLRCGTSDEGMVQRHYDLPSSSHRNTYHIIHPFLCCYCCSRLP